MSPFPKGKTTTSLRIKVFSVDNRSSTLRTLKPKRGFCWDPRSVENILAEIAADLERRFPLQVYRRIQIGLFAFNFISEGVKDGAPKVDV